MATELTDTPIGSGVSSIKGGQTGEGGSTEEANTGVGKFTVRTGGDIGVLGAETKAGASTWSAADCRALFGKGFSRDGICCGSASGEI